MPVYSSTTELQTRLQRLPNLPDLPTRDDQILAYLVKLNQAINDFYGRLAERLQHFVEITDPSETAFGAADTSSVITFGSGLADDAYVVLTSPSWNTKIWVSAITTDGFTINASDAPGGGGGTVRWAITH